MSQLHYKRCGSMGCASELRSYCSKRKSGAFQLEGTRLRDAAQLEKLYLVAAVALLYGTLMGATVQIEGLRQQVDAHSLAGAELSEDWATLVTGGRWQKSAVATRISHKHMRKRGLKLPKCRLQGTSSVFVK